MHLQQICRAQLFSGLCSLVAIYVSRPSCLDMPDQQLRQKRAQIEKHFIGMEPCPCSGYTLYTYMYSIYDSSVCTKASSGEALILNILSKMYLSNAYAYMPFALLVGTVN